ncbi:MAG: hypothetical protein ACYCPQ_01250 [Elusimicrobiota bacterium]
MSLKIVHVVFIAASASTMAFLLYWTKIQQASGFAHPGLECCGAAGFAAAVLYLIWFLRHYEKL